MASHARQLLADRYKLLTPFRRDGGGIMWQAHDLRLKRDVAIKEVQPPYRVDVADLPAARRQALREARSAARLSHPAVITVHDLLEDKGRLWIVTELLQGLTLGDTVRHLGRLPVHWAAWVGFQLLSGVRHAHAMGVVHGDIRPGNVTLTEDRVVLTDFGIAAFDRDVTGPATVPVTRSGAYLAPERLRGEALTPTADLWSFGATLYCGVEGRPPYPSMGPLSAGMMLGREPDPPRRAGPLRPLIEGLLRRDPLDRLTIEQAMQMLVEVLRRQGIPAAAPGRTSGELPSRARTNPYGHSPALGAPPRQGELTAGFPHGENRQRGGVPRWPAPPGRPRRPGGAGGLTSPSGPGFPRNLGGGHPDGPRPPAAPL
ncbi:serine/threonine-protein kinase [Microbispora sp. H10949]|uniref:serine/threonine-protein kinase n=1 Tax=Microbispora sp. H10949 TaxID=2729111 RepID=UPI001602BFE3|nr:serine/threonine-protein kinase [Microbispora sp. H10949]